MTAIFVGGIGAGAAPSGIFSQLQVARPRRGRCRSRRPHGTVEPTPYAVRSYDAVVPAYGAAFDKASWAPVATWLAGLLIRERHGHSHLSDLGDDHRFGLRRLERRRDTLCICLDEHDRTPELLV
jgi:hypothetical protein